MPGDHHTEEDLDAWVAAGLISAEQRTKILAWEHAHARSGRSLTTIFALVGAAVIVLGITLIVATNWQHIALMTKLSAGVALLVVLYGAGYWVHFGPLARGKSGEALMLIGSGVFLGDLALVSQQYHIFENFSPLFLLFWLAVAPLSYVLRSRAYAFVGAAAFLVWVGTEMIRRGSVIEAREAAWWFLLIAGAAAAVLVAGSMHRLTRASALAAPIEVVGGAVTLFAVYMLGFYRHLVPHPATPVGTVVVALMLGGPVLLLFAALVVDALRRRPGSTTEGRLPVYAGAAALVATLAWSVLVARVPRWAEEQELILWTAGYWVLAIALTIALGWLGVAFRRPAWLNLALLFTGVFTLTRYFDLFSDFGQTGLLFVGAGALLLAVAFVLERSRRVLTALAGEPR